jgi:AcrR family transcriptional regulator
MSQEDRRRMIVRAVLPLVIEHGGSVTTSQIARAAGIGEGTIFRAFTDKDELVDACKHEALRPDDALDAIAEIPLDQPLEDRLTEAASALSAYLERMGALMSALYASGQTTQRKRPEHVANEKSPSGDGRSDSMTAMGEAVADLFEPEKDALRLPAEQTAGMFLALLFSRTRRIGGSGDEKPDPAQLVEVFLHGAVRAG